MGNVSKRQQPDKRTKEHPKATNISLTQRENHTPKGVLKLTP